MSAPNPDELVARARRAKAFARRDAAAKAGIHIPALGELLRNQSFYRDSWEEDAKYFAERLLQRIETDSLFDTNVRTALEGITMAPTAEQSLYCAAVLRNLVRSRTKIARILDEGARRCELYAAMQADVPSMLAIAGYAAKLATFSQAPSDESLQYTRSAIGWLTLAASGIDPWLSGSNALFRHASTLGTALLNQAIKEHFNHCIKPKEANTDNSGRKRVAVSGNETASFDPDNPKSAHSVIVLPRVGNDDIGEGKKVKKEFDNLVGQPLPLVSTPDLDSVTRILNNEFPHAAHVTSTILSELGSRSHVRLPPILFVGPPGGGKSRYAMRLLDALNVKAAAYPCGGVADSTFIGTSRRWTTGAPAFPIGLIRQFKTASPGVVLDELERASANRYNGSIFDALLAMLEPSTAATWVDPYIEAPVNLTHVIWVATANELGQIPTALRDRFRAFAFPSPTAEHIPILAHQILRKLVTDLGWDGKWATPLDQEELDALASVWQGGSLRVLRRFVQGIWRARLGSLTLQ